MTNHLDRLTIKAFRQFEDATFDGLGRVNLLVGENNSGKSTVLEALEYLCDPVDPLSLLDIARRREITSKDLEATTALRWLFPKQPYSNANEEFLKAELEVVGSSGSTQRTAHAEFEKFLADIASMPVSDPSTTTTTAPPEADQRRKGVRLTLTYDSTGEQGQGGFAKEEYTILEGVPLQVRSSVKISGIPAATVTSVSHRVETTQTRRLSDVTIDYLKRDTIELLQLIDPDIRGLDILDTGGRSVIWLDLLGMGFIPLSVCGDGLRRILAFATSLSQAQTGILLIDEIETAIHKDAFVKVFKWLVNASKKLDVQIFATTHSIEAIDAMLLAESEVLEDLVAFRLPARGSEQVLTRHSGQTLKDLRFEGGMEVR